MREEEKNNLNDSNFQNEGEYIINKKPKYKYEIKIVHEKPREQAKKSKTPNQVISLTRLNLSNKSQKGLKKQNYEITRGNNNHYDNYNNYHFYDSKSQINEPKTVRNYSKEAIPQVASQLNIYSNTCRNFYKNAKKDKYNYGFNHYNENIEKKQCICHQEFNKMIQEYFGRGKKIKNNNIRINDYEYPSEYINSNEYSNERNNIFISNDNNIRKNNEYYRNDYDYPRLRLKKSFKYPLKIQKSVNKIFQNKKRDLTPTNYGRSKYIDYNSNNIFLEASNLSKNRKNIRTGNFSNKNILQKSNINQYLYIKNRKEKIIKENNNNNNNNNINNFKSNYSFVSIDDSKNKSSNSQYNSTFFSKKENNPIMIEYKNNNTINNLNNSPSPSMRSGNNNELMIYKSSERKEQIRKLPRGQEIKPLIIKKKVKRPIIEKIKKEDGTTINVIKQTSIVTSIETKPVIDLQKKQFNNDNLVKECITNIYTTLTKKVDDEDDENENDNKRRKLNKNKSSDNINNEVFVKRKIMGKNMKQHNLSNLNDKSGNGLENEIKKEKIDYSKNKFNIDISAISNDLLVNKNNNSSINYSSLYSNVYDQIEPSNNALRVNDEIKYIKYLYYRSSNLNSSNKEKSQSLSNYFLKLSDDEKISIITNLNDGNIENKKIYNKLINILKERRLKNENSKNNSNNTSGDIFINDNDDLKKIKRKPPNNILFKKKKVIK